MKITQIDDSWIHHIQYHTDTPNLHPPHHSHDHKKWFDEFILDLSPLYPSDKNSQLHPSPSSTMTKKLSLHHLCEFLQSFSILSISYTYLVNVQRNFPCITIQYRVWPSHPWTHRLSRLHPPPLRPYHSLPWSPAPKTLPIYPSIPPCDHFALLLTAIRPLYQKFHVPKSPVTSDENISAADQKTSQKLVPAADMWQNCRYNVVQWLCGLLVGMYTTDYLLY